MRASYAKSWDRDHRRLELAWRLIALDVRTKIIVAWTGLSKYQVVAMFRNYVQETGKPRPRGHSVLQAAYFVKKLSRERESTALAIFLLEMEIIPTAIGSKAAKELPGLTKGERVLRAYNLYRTMVPDGMFSFEDLALLAVELTSRRHLALAHCHQCKGIRLIDRYGPAHKTCAFCRGKAASKSHGLTKNTGPSVGTMPEGNTT